MTIFQKILTLSALSAAMFYLTAPAFASEAIATDPNSPIILETAKIQNGTQNKVLVKGLIKPGNEALIYINGNYSGLANISQGNEQFSLFKYLSPTISKTPNIEVLVIARDITSRLLSSPTQNTVNTTIEEASYTQPETNIITRTTQTLIPSPVLKTPNQKNCQENVYISGFSKNQTLVKIFIDNKLFTNLRAVNNVSENAFFEYTPTLALERGQHLVYVIAEDDKGNSSQKSNTIPFCISRPQTASTSTINNLGLEISSSTISENTNASSVHQETSTPGELTKKNSNPFVNIKALIFILFIIIILIWIIVVNRELLKDNENTTPKDKQLP